MSYVLELDGIEFHYVEHTLKIYIYDMDNDIDLSSFPLENPIDKSLFISICKCLNPRKN